MELSPQQIECMDRLRKILIEEISRGSSFREAARRLHNEPGLLEGLRSAPPIFRSGVGRWPGREGTGS